MTQLRFGIIGTGNITDIFLKGASLCPEFKAVAIYSRTRERGEMFATKHGIPNLFTDLKTMLESPEINAVYIASPNHLHASQAIMCMEYGKHVLCEKPLASNALEAGSMIDVAKRQGVLLMEAMIATVNPNFKRVADNISRIGTIHRYFSSYCQYSSRYDKYKAGELPNVFNPIYSSGALMDIGIYTIYPMVALFGSPESVNAEGIILTSGVDAQGTILCRYPEMEATLIYSKIANSYLPTEIEGECGNMILNEIHDLRKVSLIPRPHPSSGQNKEFDTIDLNIDNFTDLYYYEVREFVNTIASGSRESAVNSHFNSLTTLEIIDEVRRQLNITFPADLKAGC